MSRSTGTLTPQATAHGDSLQPAAPTAKDAAELARGLTFAASHARIERLARPAFWDASSSAATECTLHQLAPYLGKMKSSIAGALIDRFVPDNGAVLDPFCGAGSVLLEARLRGHDAIGLDWNAYACVVARAKLHAPLDETLAGARLDELWDRTTELRAKQDLRKVPVWVRDFFHRETLRDTLAFRDACVESGEDFFLACLLSILHHQRPGFLSYPASHLVPYLRTRKFPKAEYPELYERREVLPRLRAKVARALRRVPDEWLGSGEIVQGDARTTSIPVALTTVVTSPPYMNELDYVRDNRLRLWMVGRDLPDGQELPARERERTYMSLLRGARDNFGRRLAVGGRAVLVVGEVTRRRRAMATAVLTDVVMSEATNGPAYELSEVFTDQIPESRRARRACRGTRVETVLAYRRTS